MNDRIKQLVEQAEEYASQFVYVQAIGHPGYTEKFNEKFAELIVAECMRLNSKELSITAIERLLPLYKEHFGVDK